MIIRLDNIYRHTSCTNNLDNTYYAEKNVIRMRNIQQIHRTALYKVNINQQQTFFLTRRFTAEAGS